MADLNHQAVVVEEKACHLMDNEEPAGCRANRKYIYSYLCLLTFYCYFKWLSILFLVACVNVVFSVCCLRGNSNNLKLDLNDGITDTDLFLFFYILFN